MERGDVSRDSAEYAETLAEVFVEMMQKAGSKSALCEDDPEITPALMECLQYVYLHGASPIRQIADGLEISLSAASQLVDRLVRKSLVTRRENEQDRRLSDVELTREGESHVVAMRQRKSQWFDDILRGIPASHRKGFREGLESFLGVALASEENVDRACVKCGIEHAAFCVVNKVKSKRLADHLESGAVQ